MRWCRTCVLPDTRPNLELSDDGTCQACRTHGRRSDTDWAARKADFAALVEDTRSRAQGYHCVIPVSGGKDSTWQVVTCLEHGLKPLAVTWKTPARTEIGAANLANLIELGVDHIDYQVSPAVERIFMLEAFRRFGDPGIPMHMALFNIPLSIAARFRIPLVVWGEDSAVEYSGARGGTPMDEAWLRRYGVTHGTTADDWVSEDLTALDLLPYRGPSGAELEAAGVRAVFLGHYFGWDPEESLRVARDHGFRPRPEGPKTGLYDYADIDDDFIAVHHHLKWHKFGFTRLFDNLSIEIRNGRLTRDEALQILRERGPDVPHADIERFCAFVGITRQEFEDIADGFRNPEIWKREEGQWRMPEFLIDDWEWT